MMTESPDHLEILLLQWYSKLNAKFLDIVGDYAGNELFAIEADSLFRECFNDEHLDFQDGFQLLHAVYIVESFLQNLDKRGCQFDLIAFSNHQQTCQPHGGLMEAKYLLARYTILQHFKRQAAKEETKLRVFEFDHLADPAFDEYLQSSCPHFIACSDGASYVLGRRNVATLADHQEADHEEKPFQFLLRLSIHELMRKGLDVALINGLEWQDSKVFTFVLERVTVPPDNTLYHHYLRNIQNMSPISQDSSMPKTTATLVVSKALDYDFLAKKFPISSIEINGKLNHRALITFMTLGSMIEAGLKHMIAQCCIIHTLLLDALKLSARPVSTVAFSVDQEEELRSFLNSFCTIALSIMRHPAYNLNPPISGGLEDFFDGRLFRWIFSRATSDGMSRLPDCIIEETRIVLKALGVEDDPIGRNGNISLLQEETFSLSASTYDISVSPFSHPAFDKHLSSIQVKTTNPRGQHLFYGKPSNGLTHWHSTKAILPKKGSLPQKLRTRREIRMRDRYNASVEKYAVSLTNGNALKSELIIVGSTTPRRNLETQPKVPDSSQVEKWNHMKESLEKNSDLKSRYRQLEDYISSRGQDLKSLESEVETFKLGILRDIWKQYCKQNDKPNGIHIATMIDVSLQRLMKTSPVALSKTSKNLLLKIARECGIQNLPSRKSITAPLSITADLVRFRLRHEGPYMERGMGSKKDPRTNFQPDAWQREVLDALDASESLLVVAPTSSGKTFISFYAMEKVLRTDDKGVVVYVAPNKALVNQIAAEVHARFKKNYRPGRTLYSIHTRDYHIHEPRRCQILITVPHILQIMLMSSTSADWVPNIKTIIFDEVHCINQTDDGLVWEQLLIMAPCQIIALSATVGNPNEFASWLTSTQKSTGQKFKMIENEHRFSDLRKYIYVPPKEFKFNGLVQSEDLLPLGLDGIDELKFLHPICSLTNPSRGIPKDLALESRDCLMLFEAMERHSTPGFPFPDRLTPEKFFADQNIVKRKVISWGSELKDLLGSWMKDHNSPFHAVLKELSKPLLSKATHELESHRRQDPDEKCLSGESSQEESSTTRLLTSTTLPLLCRLQAANALPAILFSYNRQVCEALAYDLVDKLVSAETTFKETNRGFKSKLAKFNAAQVAARASNKKKGASNPNKRGLSELDKQARDDDATKDHTIDSFDPNAPLDAYSFANIKKRDGEELADILKSLSFKGIDNKLIEAFKRGIGVHHAGMNLKYRQAVEMWFRRGYLTVVIATGTLSLGINMPCKTVVFSGDSVYLTALNFRQAAGRAGRRGFDLLGNVVFQEVSVEKACRLLSSRLPDLNGHFPLTTSFVLRMFNLLHGANNAPYAMKMVNAILSQPRLYLGGNSFQHQVLHHLRFSIEYLQNQGMINSKGEPIDFANCVMHLYYTEQGAFAFHALLRGGYFSNLASQFSTNAKEALKELMITMAHLFGRRPLQPIEIEPERRNIKGSPSVVILPPLPSEASQILKKHNEHTLRTYENYVRTYVDQHCHEPDQILPFTKTKITNSRSLKPLSGMGATPVSIRSAFVTLSGHGDRFDSISSLCSTVRDGVFLEKAVVPHLEVDEDAKTLLNAFLYDFFQHGAIKPLENANRIRKGDIWFLLNDFSMILATVIVAIEQFLQPCDGADSSSTIATGLFDQRLVNSDDDDDDDDRDHDELDEEENHDLPKPSQRSTKSKKVQALRPNTTSASASTSPSSSNPISVIPSSTKQLEILDDWADEDNDSDLDSNPNTRSTSQATNQPILTPLTPVSSSSAILSEPTSPTNRYSHSDFSSLTPVSSVVSMTEGDMTGVLKMFKMLKHEFDTKFQKTWA